MEYLNEIIMQNSPNPLAKIAAIMLPNVYEAMNLSDFERDHKQIVPTTRIWPFGCFYLGSAIIFFQNRLALSRKNNNICGQLQLSDLNTTLEVEELIDYEDLEKKRVNSRTELDERVAIEGKVDLYNTGLKYNIKSGKVSLIFWDNQCEHPGKRSKLEIPLNIIWDAIYSH